MAHHENVCHEIQCFKTEYFAVSIDFVCLVEPERDITLLVVMPLY